MNFHTDDELDRALFDLALEQPPADLRAKILATTAYAPPPAFSLTDVIAIGVLGAVGLWLAIAVVMGGGALFERAVATVTASALAGLGNVSTLAWIAAGGACAIWLSLFTGNQPFARAGERAERR